MRQDWELKTLKDIGAIFSGNSINAKIKEKKYSGLPEGLPYVATKDIGYNSIINYENGIKIPYDEVDSFKVAPKNSVLICAEGGSAGRKVGRLTQDVCFVNKLFAITLDNEAASKYLYYWYKSNTFKEELDSRLLNKFKDSVDSTITTKSIAGDHDSSLLKLILKFLLQI